MAFQKMRLQTSVTLIIMKNSVPVREAGLTLGLARLQPSPPSFAHAFSGRPLPYLL